MSKTKSKNEKKAGTVFHYLKKGPKAVEKRLAVLDKKLQVWETRLTNLASLHMKMPGLKKGIGYFQSLGERALAEIQKERASLHMFVGDRLRSWEKEKTGPAPL